jgi:hypothetical protein
MEYFDWGGFLLIGVPMLFFALIGVPMLFLVLIRYLDGSRSAFSARAGLAGWLGQVKLWQVAAAVALTACVYAVLMARHQMGGFPFFLIVLCLIGLFLHAWRREFLFVMSRRDDEFPGSNDRLIWILLLIAFPPVGYWLFRPFREEHWPEPVPERVEGHVVTDL